MEKLSQDPGCRGSTRGAASAPDRRWSGVQSLRYRRRWGRGVNLHDARSSAAAPMPWFTLNNQLHLATWRLAHN
jgi:hypothetical protein